MNQMNEQFKLKFSMYCKVLLMQYFSIVLIKLYYVENKHSCQQIHFKIQKPQENRNPQKIIFDQFGIGQDGCFTIISENVSTRQAAQKLQIKYSTAKYIMKNFKNKGNCLDEHQHPQSKQKSIIQNVNIVIDVSDGSIMLAKNNQKISYCDFSSLQEEYKNQNLLQTSELIYEKLGKISWHKFHYKECRDEEMLKKFLLRQHILMKQE